MKPPPREVEGGIDSQDNMVPSLFLIQGITADASIVPFNAVQRKSWLGVPFYSP